MKIVFSAKMTLIHVAVLVLILLPAAHAFADRFKGRFTCIEKVEKPVVESIAISAPTSDFELRDTFSQASNYRPKRDFRFRDYGVCPATYPRVEYPPAIDSVAWARLRVVEAAKKWIGLPYKHKHIPQSGGLDCSNFTSFVYNYALGIRIDSSVSFQAQTAGLLRLASEELQPGDLLFIFNEQRTRISHVAIYINNSSLIDSTGPGVQIRAFEGWYKDRLAFVRHVL